MIYQPPPPPAPKPNGRGLVITLVAVIVAAVLVAAVSLVFLLTSNKDDADPPVAASPSLAAPPTIEAPTEPPVTQPPTDPPSPTADPPEPPPVPESRLNDMQTQLEDTNLVVTYRLEWEEPMGRVYTTASTALDGTASLVHREVDDQRLQTIQGLVQGDQIMATTISYTAKQWTAMFHNKAECEMDQYCTTPGQMNDSVMEMLWDLCQAALDNRVESRVSRFGGTDVIGYTLVSRELPQAFQEMGAIEVTLWIDQVTARPFQVDSLLDKDRLVDGLLVGEREDWGQRVMANYCISAIMDITDDPCQAHTNFRWTTRDAADGLLDIKIPPGYNYNQEDFDF